MSADERVVMAGEAPRPLYRALWPVREPWTLQQLRDEAEPDLARMLNLARLAQAGRARWSLRFGDDVPGSGGAEVVLMVCVPVVRVPRPQDPPVTSEDARQPRPGRPGVDAERVHMLDREGMPTALIADVLGCSTRTVTRARGRVDSLAVST